MEQENLITYFFILEFSNVNRVSRDEHYNSWTFHPGAIICNAPLPEICGVPAVKVAWCT